MKELLVWLEHNSEVLAGRDLENVRDLAIAAGHDRTAVAQWYTTQRFKRAI